MTVRELIVKLKAAEELAGDEAEVRLAAVDGDMLGQPPYRLVKVTVDRCETVELQLAPWQVKY